jgi:uncharacterized protein (UPF0332 family)
MNNYSISLINYRIERAYTSLKEARLMLDNQLKHGAINRLYYSCFYIIMAALQQKGFTSKTHKGIKFLFNEHLIKTKELDIEKSWFYSNLFNYRHITDYDLIPEFTDENFEDLYEKAENFIKDIEIFIKQNTSQQ